MVMCYDGALVMPSNYAVMDSEEMTYVEGGIALSTVATLITIGISVCGASYGSGVAVGQRLYYAGIRTSKQWSKYKWSARAVAVAISPVLGSVFMLGVENKLYSMICGR